MKSFGSPRRRLERAVLKLQQEFPFPTDDDELQDQADDLLREMDELTDLLSGHISEGGLALRSRSHEIADARAQLVEFKNRWEANLSSGQARAVHDVLTVIEDVIVAPR